MPKIMFERERVEIEVPTDCRNCDHRYGNMCRLFDQEVTSYGNVGNDWGFKRCEQCKAAEVEDEV